MRAKGIRRQPKLSFSIWFTSGLSCWIWSAFERPWLTSDPSVPWKAVLFACRVVTQRRGLYHFSQRLWNKVINMPENRFRGGFAAERCCFCGIILP